ncbi:hypothetical protein Q3G72_003159 [Acer saccharum]|nr:hypothetical protein Q3G72_003159 [Acer saccharum]
MFHSSSSNQGGSAHQPQLSEAQFLANELWRGLVQPNVNRGGWLSPTQSLGVQPNVNPGQSVPQDVNPGGRLSPTQSEDQFDIPDGGVQPNVNPGGSAHHPQLTETQSAPNEIGAALQMQRELQWFKEVEEITFTYRREWKDDDDKTPKDVTELQKWRQNREHWWRGVVDKARRAAQRRRSEMLWQLHDDVNEARSSIDGDDDGNQVRSSCVDEVLRRL